MDQELISYLDRRFDAMDQRFDAMDQRFEELDQRFEEMDKRLKELKQDGNETRILLEALRRDVQLIAEGLAAGFDEGLKRTRSEHDDEIEEVRTFNRLSYSELQRRMTILEDWKERLTGTDPIAMVRERFGLKPREV